MAYTKKKWVNVPDPSNPPSIPEGQDALARFDADNMNRIEEGIEEVCAPTYTEVNEITPLTSGEKLTIAFGKIKKAISDLITHLSNKKNPHGVTAAQAGALPISGGIISGRSVGLADGYGSIASDKNCTTVIAKNLTDSANNSRQIYIANSSYAPKVDDSIFLHDTIDGVAKKYYLYGEHHKPTADEIGAMPAKGGTMTGNLTMYKETTPVMYFKTNKSSSRIMKNASDTADGGLLLTDYADINDGSAYAHLSLCHARALSSTKDLLQVIIAQNGTTTAYDVFGNHNKPTGTYIGDGSSTKREINVGGTGNAVLVYEPQVSQLAIVTEAGAIYGNMGSVQYKDPFVNHVSYGAQFKNGILYIGDAYELNTKTQIYRYQVL